MNIGIYSGSFNPMHIGHIILGDFLVQNSSLDQIWYLVTPQNPLKNKEILLSQEHRFKMVKEALAEYPSLVASDFEFHLPRPSYTLNALQGLRETYLDCNFHLIIGADNWFEFYNWKEYKKILSDFEVYVFSRYGFRQYMHRWTRECKIKKVIFVHSPIIEISSTSIRKMIAENISPRPYLPIQVFNYIQKHNLYK